MGQALMTAVGLGFIGVTMAAVTGLTAADEAALERHISYGFFSTMVTLLAHSMMMFYLIGKGKAVKDAMAEGGYGASDNPQYKTYAARIATARRPVFSVGTLAMTVTMVTAILGASVDTGVLPAVVHAVVGYGAIACNAMAIRVEIAALGESSRVVDEVNRLLSS